jgi:transcriptional antiterminator RfaH
VEVFNPQLRLVRSTRRGRVWCIESLFPNYLFARFVPPSMLEKIRYTPGVKVVLQFGDRLPVIPDSVIEELRQSLATDGARVFTDAPMEGEEVEIAVGPFQGIKGPVIRVLPAKQRVQILLDVMGRAVPAELSFESVLFKRRAAASVVLSRAEPLPALRALSRSLPLESEPLSIPNNATLATTPPTVIPK